VEPADVHPPRDVHHRVFGRVEAHCHATRSRHHDLFAQAMSVRGTDFGKMFARQPWAKPSDYKLLDASIQHQLNKKQDITPFWRAQS
jgi:hypothetical protein